MTCRERREREQERRALALQLCCQLGDTPETRRQVAAALGLTERTLRRWAQRAREDGELVPLRGRPPRAVPREQRQGLIAALLRLGPCAGVKVLRALFVDVPYRLIAKLKRRFAHALQRRRGWYRQRLEWLEAGAVWATDFTHPAAPLPEPDDRLLLVRDLGSGKQLAAVPCRGECATIVCTVLATLFVVFGAPLVLKHDGGSAFCAEATQELLRTHGVVPLRSPPRTPSYNGSCERAGGTLKLRIAHAALVFGHPERWSDAGITQALLLANTTARPHGVHGPTPAESFGSRRPIGRRERAVFQQTRAEEIAQALRTHESKHGTMPTCSQHAAIVRSATQRALCKHGYLQIRRGRLSTPISTWKAVTNT